MQDLVFVDNNQPVTSSRSVAEHFEKRHDHVIRDIETLINSADEKDRPKIGEMFYESTEPDTYGREQKVYYMNEKGFSILVMGFTGAKALSWKLKYIDAFDKMRKQLAVPQLKPNPHYRTRMIGTGVQDMAKTRDALIKSFDVKPGMATAIAITSVCESYGIDPKPYRALIPAEEHPGYLNATMIAEQMGLKFKSGKPNGAAANNLLASAGLMEKHGKHWRLTDKGRKYGEEKPYTNHGHSDYHIVWNDGVYEVLK